jgi:uncharacterized protein YbaA (DUF1428 family)
MNYVDGYLLPVPRRNLAAYRRMARLGAKIWLEHGALEYRECVGDDLAPPCGTPFPKLMKLRRGEVPVFSWIVYRSKAQRDRVNAAVMKDPRMVPPPGGMPFDLRRMAVGGFRVLVEG